MYISLKADKHRVLTICAIAAIIKFYKENAVPDSLLGKLHVQQLSQRITKK